MIIDYSKDIVFWGSLKAHSNYLLIVSNGFVYRSHNFDLKQDEVSNWFEPMRAKYQPIGRSFPEPHEASKKDFFQLYLTLSNYLPLFLINRLYSNKQILIEDIGVGDGKLEYYLSKLGFDNFHFIENFSNVPKKLLDTNLKGLSYKLNDIQNVFPTVVINSGSYTVSADITPRWTPSIELAVCYTHEKFDCKEFTDRLEQWGYKLLCRDVDNLAIAFARHDKHEEFKELLKLYECK